MPKKLLLCLALVACSTRAFSWSKQMQFDCAELGPGATQSYIETFPVRNKFATQIVVNVDASNIGTAEAPKCRLKWTVSSKLAGHSKALFSRSDDPKLSNNGVSFGGTSQDGSKLLLDFFSTVGDSTHHRPAVYDFSAGSWQILDVGDRITQGLPKCDYLTMIQGVTDAGDVILYVPKSTFTKGCPDQGEWLLNMKDDAITRLTRKDAAR